MKLLFAYNSGSNCNYLGRMLDLQALMFKDFSYSFIRSSQYERFDQDNFDILIYQTFPDENHTFKFNTELVKQRDEKFLEFKGVKILMDSFDDGAKDAFSRMGDASKTLPRIKSVPSWSFLKEFNIIYSVPPYLGSDLIPDMEDGERDVVLHYAPTIDTGNYSHKVRGEIMEVLCRDFKEGNYMRISRKSYPDFLKRVQMSVTGPGFGPCSNTFWTAMQYGTLSIAEETVDQYKVLPRADIIPGKDYVSFNLETLIDKLRYLLKNPDECDQIRKSGHEKIKEGYNIEKSAREFYAILGNL